jgi:hypothetical protein
MMERQHDTIRELILSRSPRAYVTPAILECWFERDGVTLGAPLARAA